MFYIRTNVFSVGWQKSDDFLNKITICFQSPGETIHLARHSSLLLRFLEKLKNVELGREVYEEAGLEGDWWNRENTSRSIRTSQGMF